MHNYAQPSDSLAGLAKAVSTFSSPIAASSPQETKTTWGLNWTQTEKKEQKYTG